MPLWKLKLLDALDEVEIAYLHADDARFALALNEARTCVAQSTLEVNEDWRPIQSAPRTGCKVDLWIAAQPLAYRLADCWWDRACAGWRSASLGSMVPGTPTHWREIVGP